MNSTTVDILRESAAIFEGRHPAYGGDRVANAIGYLHLLGRVLPGAADVADDMVVNPELSSDCCGLHPDRVLWCANRIREGIK